MIKYEKNLYETNYRISTSHTSTDNFITFLRKEINCNNNYQYCALIVILAKKI